MTKVGEAIASATSQDAIFKHFDKFVNRNDFKNYVFRIGGSRDDDDEQDGDNVAVVPPPTRQKRKADSTTTKINKRPRTFLEVPITRHGLRQHDGAQDDDDLGLPARTRSGLRQLQGPDHDA